MANSVDPDEMAHHESSHQTLHCLQYKLLWYAGFSWLNISCDDIFTCAKNDAHALTHVQCTPTM